MALTKVGKEGITGVSNSSDATAITIDSSENVGIGLTTPTAPLTVKAPSGAEAVHIHGRSDDIGQLVFLEADATTKIGRIDARNSQFTVGSVADIPFTFITGTSERMRIDSSGEVFFGTTSRPSASVGGACFEPAGDNRMILNLGCTSTSSRNVAVFRNSNNGVGSINVSGSTTGFNTSSDYRLKENVVTDWDATTRLKQLKPSRFNFKIDKDTTVDGFLAHEVSSVVPEAITGTKDAVDADGNPEYQGIDQSKLVPLLVKTIQELEARIATLESK